MADVKNEKIIDNLTRKFKRGSRFVFWYDDHGEFLDEIPDIAQGLDGVAEVEILRVGEQLKMKSKLLSAPADEKFLIYSPEKQPYLEENHLRDIFLYSDSFTADAQEIIRRDLNLPEKLRSFVKVHSKFFGSKERRNKFAKYELSSFEKTPEMAILASLVNSKRIVVSYFDILRIVLCDDIEDNPFLEEFSKYDVLDSFWDYARKILGYNEENPTLLRLSASLFLTETYHQMGMEMPEKTSSYNLMTKYPNVSTFINQFSNFNFMGEDKFEKVAQQVWDLVDGGALFLDVDRDDIVKSSVFPIFDRMILIWEQDRLLQHDFETRLNEESFPEVVKNRLEMHFGYKYKDYYLMMESAWYLLSTIRSHPGNTTQDMIDEYVKDGYLVDMYYRQFILNYQKSGMKENFIKTKTLVEHEYSDGYLNNYISSWTEKLKYRNLTSRHLQRNFYENYIKPETNRIVVIISDAFRFEAAKELQADLSMDDQITGQEMDYMVTGLPSVTYMGMPALLPNKSLELTNKKLLVDGVEATNREKREKILINANPNSAAYALDDLKGASSREIKQLFVNKQVVYIYHNQIDAIADNKKTEDDVFKATSEAIQEIKSLISRLRTNGVSQFFVTSDHGYIYRDETLTDADKIAEEVYHDDWKSQRYIVSDSKIDEPGIGEQKLSDILNNDDKRFVYYPETANVFKSAGSFNYVHGGASLQEMIVPLLKIKATSSRSQAQDVDLRLVSSNRNITSLEVKVKLLQEAPIDSMYRATVYNIYFVDDENEPISAKQTVNANSTETAVEARMNIITINLIDQQYDKSRRYYLVIENTNTGEGLTTEYQMDIAGLSPFDF